MAETLILGELTGKSLDPITGEMIAAAKGISDNVRVALMGLDLDHLAEQVIAIGADEVFIVHDPLLSADCIEAHVYAFEQICKLTMPAVVLTGKTPMGREVGPRVAFSLGMGVSQDSISVKISADSGSVVSTRPVYGGNALATVEFLDADGQFIVLRRKSYEPLKPNPSRTGIIHKILPKINPSSVKIQHVETVPGANDELKMEDSPVIVAGGRGIGGSDGFRDLADLADLLKGAVAASRGACDAGWIDHAYQVGLTGKTVTPQLYWAVGISGASQHMSGCSGSKHIIAVNNDPDANIFREASFGVVGDWCKIIRAFVATARDLELS